MVCSYLKRNLVALENKLDTEYTESRRMKDALDDIRIENDKINEDLFAKNVEIKDFKQTVAKVKVAHEKLENKLKHFEEDNLMLQNVVANKSTKVSELETLVKTLTSYNPCDKCGNSPGTRDCLNEHEDKTHQDEIIETVPSNYKCGPCDFESDDEKNISMHVKS